MGTIAAIGYRTLYLVFYPKKNILFHSPLNFLKNITVDIITALTVILFTNHLDLANVSYISWFIMAIKAFLITFAVTFVINVIINRKIIKATFLLGKSEL